MRFDFLITFSHGIPYLREIMSVIRDFPDIQIDFIKRFNALDIRPTMSEFIEGLYGCDKVPIEHLRGKTAYLSDLSPEFVFVLIKNLAPDEKMFGEGEFAHIQCARIKELKEIIRDKWNPYSDGKRTENHVIHGSDYQEQTEYVLDFLKLPPIAHFNRPTEYNLRYFVELERFQVRKIPMDKIICKTAFGQSKIKNGIWLKYVKGNKKPYTDYIEKVIGIRDFDDHYPEAFDKLIEGFLYRDLIAVEETEKGFVVIDGTHRAAIVYSWGEKEIAALVEERKYSAKFLRKILSDCVVIRKKKHFPKYYIGQDVDLVCMEPGKIVEKMKGIEGWEVHEKRAGFHIDWMKDGKIHLRLDVVSSLIDGDEKYIQEVVIRSKVHEGFRYPCQADEIILRGIEYATHTEKKWHFDYINNV